MDVDKGGLLMGFAFFIVLIILGFLRPESKIVTLLIATFMWIIYGLNTMSGDYIAYENVYTNFISEGFQNHFEPLFSLLMSICVKLGISYQGFLMVLATIFICLTYLAIKQYTKYTALALSIYMIFPFVCFVSQLRIGIASAIIIYSIKYLISNEKNSTLKYLIFLLLATLIHYSSLLYIILLLTKIAKNNNKINRRKLYVFTFIGIFIASTVFSFSSIGYDILSLVTDRGRIIAWFSDPNIEGLPNTVGLVTEIIVLIGTIYVAYIAKNKYIPIIGHKSNSNEIEVANTGYSIAIVLLITLPFIVRNSTFMRLIYEVILIIICSCTNTIMSIKENQKTLGRAVFDVNGFIMIMWIVLFALYINYPYRGSENAMIYVFFNNLLF